MYCSDMVSKRGTSTDNDVVHINMDDCSLHCMTVNEGAENMVHRRLECGRQVGESKIHNHWFPNPKAGLEGCFPLVAVVYADVVVPPSNVESGENEGVS